MSHGRPQPGMLTGDMLRRAAHRFPAVTSGSRAGTSSKPGGSIRTTSAP